MNTYAFPNAATEEREKKEKNMSPEGVVFPQSKKTQAQSQ